MKDKSLFSTIISAFATAIPASVRPRAVIEHPFPGMKNLSERMAAMLQDAEGADVQFVFPEEPEDRKLWAHKVILKSASPVFRAMFFGPMAEVGDVRIVDSSSEAFHSMLSFIYTDKVIIRPDTIAEVMYLAKKYDVEGLVQACLTFVGDNVTRKNVVLFYKELHLFGEESILNRCLAEMDQYAHYLINNNEYLKDFTKDLFRDLLQRDTFCAREVDIFDAMKWWTTRYINRRNGVEDLDKTVPAEQIRAELLDLLPLVRFPLMTLKEFVQITIPTNILTNDEVVEVLNSYVKDTKSASERKSRYSTVNRCLNRTMSLRPSDLHKVTGSEAVTAGEQRFERSNGGALRAMKFKVNQRIFLKRVDINKVPQRVCSDRFQATIRVVDMDLNEVVGRADFVLKREDDMPRGGRYDLEVGMIELCPKISYEILISIEGPKADPEVEHAKARVSGTPELTLAVEKFIRMFPEELKITELTFVY